METVDVFISEEDVQKRVKELAAEVTRAYEGETIYVVGVLKGASIFMADLIRAIDGPITMNYVMVSSYGAGTKSTGEIKMALDLEGDLTGKRVLFIEDIIDTGLTMDFLIKRAYEKNAADVKVCALLYKPERNEIAVPIDFLGFEISNEFVVGYGIDYDRKYRNLRYIGKVRFED